MRNLPLFLCH